MALIKCPECFNAVSEQAATCPKCGHPMQASKPQAESGVDALVKEALLRDGKIEAIKVYREHTSAGLAEAKQHVERLEAGLPPGTRKNPPKQGCAALLMAGGLLLLALVIFVVWTVAAA